MPGEHDQQQQPVADEPNQGGYDYGKTFFKSLFFVGASTAYGALTSTASEGLAGGIVIGAAMMATLSLLQRNPGMNLVVVYQLLNTALWAGDKLWGDRSHLCEAQINQALAQHNITLGN